MHRQPMDLADPRVDQIIEACETGLRRLLGTERAEVFMFAANGHGAWEVAIANLVAPGRAILVPGTGHFSESWAVQAEALGATRRAHPLGRGPADRPVAVERRCAPTPRARSPRCAWCTPTPPAASPATSRRSAPPSTRSGHPALYVVDVVASLGAAPFEMDALRRRPSDGRVAKGLDAAAGAGLRRRDARVRSRWPRATPRRAFTGTGAAARASCRTASSAARRR